MAEQIINEKSFKSNESRRKAVYKYNHSVKAKNTQKRYRQGKKGKATRIQYEQSPEGKEKRKRYNQSDKVKVQKKHYRQSKKGKITDKRYRQSEKGRKNLKLRQKRYRQSIKYKSAHKHYYQTNEYKARKAVNHAIESGKLPRADTLKCHYCPTQAKHYHHHKGYAPEHWLDVVPACVKCHKAHTSPKITG